MTFHLLSTPLALALAQANPRCHPPIGNKLPHRRLSIVIPSAKHEIVLDARPVDEFGSDASNPTILSVRRLRKRPAKVACEMMQASTQFGISGARKNALSSSTLRRMPATCAAMRAPQVSKRCCGRSVRCHPSLSQGAAATTVFAALSILLARSADLQVSKSSRLWKTFVTWTMRRSIAE